MKIDEYIQNYLGVSDGDFDISMPEYRSQNAWNKFTHILDVLKVQEDFLFGSLGLGDMALRLLRRNIAWTIVDDEEKIIYEQAQQTASV